jgi:hypothetical protein
MSEISPIGLCTVGLAACGVTPRFELSASTRSGWQWVAFLHFAPELDPICSVRDKKLTQRAERDVPLAALDGTDDRAIEVVLVGEPLLGFAEPFAELPYDGTERLKVGRGSFSGGHAADFTGPTVVNATVTKPTALKSTANAPSAYVGWDKACTLQCGRALVLCATLIGHRGSHMGVIALQRLIDLSLYSAEALPGCCESCGRADRPLTDVRCTAELSGEVWHNVYCSICIVVRVGRGYLTHNERAYGAGSRLERILPVIAETVGSWQPPDRAAIRPDALVVRGAR